MEKLKKDLSSSTFTTSTTPSSLIPRTSKVASSTTSPISSISIRGKKK